MHIESRIVELSENRPEGHIKKQEEKDMADNRNIQLTDDMLSEAVGGTLGQLGEPKYHIGQMVMVHFGREENGQTITTTKEGEIIGITASPVNWWYTIEIIIDDKTYNVKLPEDAVEHDNP